MPILVSQLDLYDRSRFSLPMEGEQVEDVVEHLLDEDTIDEWIRIHSSKPDEVH